MNLGYHTLKREYTWVQLLRQDTWYSALLNMLTLQHFFLVIPHETAVPQYAGHGCILGFVSQSVVHLGVRKYSWCIPG